VPRIDESTVSTVDARTPVTSPVGALLGGANALQIIHDSMLWIAGEGVDGGRFEGRNTQKYACPGPGTHVACTTGTGTGRVFVVKDPIQQISNPKYEATALHSHPSIGTVPRHSL
jgi:hypothetical protein